MARKAFFTTPKTKNEPKATADDFQETEEVDPTGPGDESTTGPTDSESIPRSFGFGSGDVGEDAGDTSAVADDEAVTFQEGQVRLDHLPPPPDPA